MTEPAQQPSERLGGEMRLRRLQWLCRRGMKELDVLLDAFIRRHSAALLQGEWPEFESLLHVEDDRLWDCLLDPGNPANSEFHQILNEIIHGADKQD